MAIPTLASALVAGSSGASSITPTWPTHQTDDIGLLFVESCGGEAASLSTPSGFVQVTGSPQSTGAGTAGTRITVFWVRCTSSAMASPVVADAGDHVYGRIAVFRGCVNSGNPWDVTGGGVKASASTSLTVTGITTTLPDDLIVIGATRDDDLSAAEFSAWSNGGLSSLTEHGDAGTTSGNGGGLAIVSGGLAVAGPTGDTTATVVSSVNAFLTIALKSNSGQGPYRNPMSQLLAH
jgi:hypothetical protein